MLKVTVYSSSFEFIKIAKKIFTVVKVFTDKLPSTSLKVWCKKNSVSLNYIKNKKEFNLKNKIKTKSDIGLSFGFSIIFNNNDINDFKLGIWNFHTGDLPKYQGRHPITYAFLNNEKEIALSIHKIDTKIDQGYLLYKKFVKRSERDTEKEIMQKIIKIIPNGILNSIKNYNNNKLKKIKKGKYYPPLYSGIKIDDSKKVTQKYIYNSIMAQKIYNGVLINNHRYVDAYYGKRNLKNWERLVCKNNKILYCLKKK